MLCVAIGGTEALLMADLGVDFKNFFDLILDLGWMACFVRASGYIGDRKYGGGSETTS